MLGVLRYVKLVDTKLINVIFWILIGTLSIYTIFDLFVYLLKRTCITHKTPRGHEDLEKPLLTDHETSISKVGILYNVCVCLRLAYFVFSLFTYLLLTFLNTEEGCDNENAHDCGSIYSNPPRIGHDCTYRNSLLLGTP